MIATIIIFIVGLLLLCGVIYYRVHLIRQVKDHEEIVPTRTHRWWYDHAQKAKKMTSYYSRRSVQIIILAILQLGVMVTFFARKYTLRLIERIKERVAPPPKETDVTEDTPMSHFLQTMNEYKKKLREFHQELENNHEQKKDGKETITNQDNKVE